MAVSTSPRAPLDITRIMVRPLGSPLPLGFFAFAIGLVLLSALDTSVIPQAESHRVALALLTFVVPLQIGATILAYLARDTAGGTVLGLFGGTWITLAVALLGAPPGSHSVTTAVFAFAESIAFVLVAVTAISGKPFFSVLLGFSFVRTLLFGFSQLGAPHVVLVLSGALGWATAAVAFYGGLALLLEGVKKHTVLPLFRRGRAERAVHGALEEQLREIENEPGVREQL